MAQFSLTIPTNGVSSGVPAAPIEYTVDRGMGRSTSHRVLTAAFGDGYQQRVLDGINTKNDAFNVSFKNRSASSINLLAAYLDAKAADSFDFTVTDQSGDTTLKVISQGYNIGYAREGTHTLSTTFVRVYEP